MKKLNKIEVDNKIWQEDIENLANEIVVTGINLSAYGKDLNNDGLIEIARLFIEKNG